MLASNKVGSVRWYELKHPSLNGQNERSVKNENCLSVLQGLQSDVNKNTQKYDRCLALGSQLMQVCETPAKQDIQKALAELQSRFVFCYNSQCTAIYNVTFV